MTTAYFGGVRPPWAGTWQALAVLALCLALRLVTTIHYIEDPDSLRFALAMRDYDVPRLQPHFPGYPVFCFAAKVLYAITGRFSVAFSLLGGLSLFALIHVSLSLTRRKAASPEGITLIALLAFNPMIWLLGNRYMPDLSGAALALTAFWLLTGTSNRRIATGFFLAGLLAGWRLSYVPFLIVPLTWAFLRAPGHVRRVALVLMALAGILVWMIPLVAVTGWDALIAAAMRHTAGHFNEFGGTILTETGVPRRILALFDGLWTDGLGAWSPGRNPVTLAVALGATIFGILGIARAIRAVRSTEFQHAMVLLALSTMAYALWILMFQNVVHQSRHVLPLIVPLLLLIAVGFPRRGPFFSAQRLLALFFFVAYAWTGTTLALQHRHPTAIAQARTWVETQADQITLDSTGVADMLVICPPVVRDHLLLQGVRVRILEAERAQDLPLIDSAYAAKHGFTRLLTVGDYATHIRLPLQEHRAFHHNPHVNRLWPKIEVSRYGRAP
jgi:hypothetical protein